MCIITFIMGSRNPYLINKAMKNFLFATVLTMTISQLTITIDGIIVGHFVGPDALSAISLYVPINLAVSSITTLFGLGAVVLAAKAIGRRDMDTVNNILSTALLSVIIVGMLCGVIGFSFREQISEAITHGNRLQNLFKPYFTVMVCCCVFNMLHMFLDQVVTVDGHPAVVTKSILCSFLINIAVLLLLTGPLELGMYGASTAMVCFYISGVLFLAVYVFSKKCKLKISIHISNFTRCLGGNLRQGLPLLVSNLLLMVMFLIMNNMVQDKLGADGMFTLSICINVMTISMMVSQGFGQTAMALGGFLNGQGDYVGLRLLVTRCILWVLGITVTIFVLVEVFPGAVTTMFGAKEGEMAVMAQRGIRIFVGAVIPLCLVLLFANLYQMLGYLVLSPAVVLAFPIVLLSGMYLLSTYIAADTIWYAFPIGGAIVFVITFVLSEIVRRKSPKRLSHLVLMPLDSDYAFEDISVEATTSGVYEVIRAMRQTINRVMPDADSMKIKVCVEEVLLNILYHSGAAKDGHYIDVRFVENTDNWLVSVNDAGTPFDPTVVSEDCRKNGLKLLSAYCPKIEYKYMYGQNMLFMSWPK